MRTTKELLILLKNNINFLDDSGLCLITSLMSGDNIITFEERNYLCDYIYDNKPSTKSKLYGGPNNGLYYWPKGLKEPRLRWLNYHIRINK